MKLGFFRFENQMSKLLGNHVLVSRTGYTGEDGFEMYAKPESMVDLWE